MNFIFVLGREKELALAELKSVLLRFNLLSCKEIDNPSIFRISGNLVFANMVLVDEKTYLLINSLAGVIKIYKLISNDLNDSERIISEHIKGIGSSKINFGLSSFVPDFSQDRVNKIGFAIRKKLKGIRSCRFVELKEGKELSSVLSKKNNLIGKGAEFGLFTEGIGLLVALNDPEEWSKRDYGKPRGDKYSGMIPPKLARMMVNIALGQLNLKFKNQNLKNNLEIRNLKLEIPQHEVLVVDPFCGSGNILLEALLLGCDVIGSDNSPKAVNDSKENVSWLCQNYQINGDNKVFLADATKSLKFIGLGWADPRRKIQNLNENSEPARPAGGLKIENYKCLAIVTEPYLGEPKKFKPTHNAVRGEYEKIERLYLNFLENFKLSTQLLSNSAAKQLIICLVFPIVETSDKGQFSLYQECVDEIREMGYTQIRNNFVYGRDYQVVKREIALLKFI